MPITTIIFDCFGVVCNPVLNGWYKEYSKKYDFVDQQLPELFRSFDLGMVSENDILQYFSRYEGVYVSAEELRKEIDDHLGLDGEVVQTIKDLKASGYKTALLTNANSSFFERKVYPTYPEFKNLFDAITISSVVGMVKPNPEIYLHALAEVNSEPEETLFVDDSQPNVDAANKLGIHGFLYTDSASLKSFLRGQNIHLL